MEKTLAQVAAYENRIKKDSQFMVGLQIVIFVSLLVTAVVNLYYV